ncbi:MAG: hypothetical protein ACOYO1_02130 [Bacteroidales bacterium]
MIIKLNRNQIFLLIVFIIIIYLLIDRIGFFVGSKITNGEIVEFETWQTGGKFRSTNYVPVVECKFDSMLFKFRGATDLERVYKCGDSVKVIYKSDFSNARIYSLTGFWFPAYQMALLGSLLILIVSAVYSFIEKYEIIVLNFKKISFKKTKNETKIVKKDMLQ